MCFEPHKAALYYKYFTMPLTPHVLTRNLLHFLLVLMINLLQFSHIRNYEHYTLKYKYFCSIAFAYDAVHFSIVCTDCAKRRPQLMQQLSEVRISICIRRLTQLNSLGGSFSNRWLFET